MAKIDFARHIERSSMAIFKEKQEIGSIFIQYLNFLIRPKMWKSLTSNSNHHILYTTLIHLQFSNFVVREKIKIGNKFPNMKFAKSNQSFMGNTRIESNYETIFGRYMNIEHDNFNRMRKFSFHSGNNWLLPVRCCGFWHTIDSYSIQFWINSFNFQQWAGMKIKFSPIQASFPPLPIFRHSSDILRHTQNWNAYSTTP